jgi:hypothetical protein
LKPNVEKVVEVNVCKELNINRLIIAIFLVISTHISCRLPTVHITFKNQTEHEIELFVDTLYLMTMKANSIEKCDLIHYLPSALYIKSPSIGRVYIGSAFHFDSIVGNDTFYHSYRFIGRIDDSVFREYTLPLIEIYKQKDTVLIFNK